MYPYTSRWTWFVRHPQKHLIESLDRSHDLAPAARRVLEHRIALHGRWLKIRVALLIPLSVGAVSAAAGYLIEAAGGFAAAQEALDAFQSISTTFATVFAGLFLLAGRTADQAFHDVLAVLHAQDGVSTNNK